MNSSTTVQFSDYSGISKEWINLEQEAVPYTNRTLTYTDLNQMLARVMSGISATTYISDVCSYLKIKDGTVTIDLDFYVWPSTIELPYSLQAGYGTISEGTAVELTRSFDVIFDGTNSVELPFIFVGEVSQQMPYFKSDGSEYTLDEVEFTVNPTNVSCNKTITTVLRADGVCYGFRHTLTMSLDKAELDSELIYKVYNISHSGIDYNSTTYPIAPKLGATTETWTILFHNSSVFGLYRSNGSLASSGNINSDLDTEDFLLRKDGWASVPVAGAYLKFSIDEVETTGKVIRTGYSIDNLQAEIIASWVINTETFTEVLTMEIPECVSSLLSACGPGQENSRWLINLNSSEDKYFLNVYYSTCDGEVVLERWELNE